MRKPEGYQQPAVGGSSLLVMVCVLCLTVFSMLSLSSVQAQGRIAETAIRSVSDYYAADLQAEEIFARLRTGENPAGVRESGGMYTYCVPISDRQTLHVTLTRQQDRWSVLRWQVITAETTTDDSLNVWQGINGEEAAP